MRMALSRRIVVQEIKRTEGAIPAQRFCGARPNLTRYPDAFGTSAAAILAEVLMALMLETFAHTD